MSISVRIKNITFSDGHEIQVPARGIVVLVGPNNSGKSLTLRELMTNYLSRIPNPPPKAVRGLELEMSGENDEFVAWLETHSNRFQRPSGEVFSRGGQEFDRDQLRQYWQDREQGGLRILTQFFAFFGNAENRLGWVGATSSFDTLTQGPSNPLQHLFLHPEIEREVSTICRRAFGVGLVLNRVAGSNLYLHVGDRPSITPAIDEPSAAYREALQQLPLLHEQGDGMKSFMGVLLAIMTSEYFLVFLDEPEAFLHPPQAELLGEMLGQRHTAENQIVLATHSADIIQGLLNSPADVTIVRITRDGDINRVAQLRSDAVKTLWADPLLHYSNILDALFNEAAIVCEADSDCRFYASVLDAYLDAHPDVTKPQILFTHCGGKHRMHVAIESLRAVNVPVVAIADFDVLREQETIKRLIECLGGDWNDFETDWRSVTSTLNERARNPAVAQVRDRVTEVLAAEPGASLTADGAEKIRSSIRTETGWDTVKQSGITVFSGEASGRCRSLLDRLRNLGLFVVEEGELEGFARSVGDHGTGWVAEVHRQGLVPGLEGAREFVRQAIARAVGRDLPS